MLERAELPGRLRHCLLIMLVFGNALDGKQRGFFRYSA